MATHHEASAALYNSVAWLAKHQHQAETLVREARSMAATVLSEVSQLPHAAVNYRQYLDDYTRGATRMMRDLESTVTYLRAITQQYARTSSPMYSPAPATVPNPVNALPAATTPDVDDGAPAFTGVQAVGSSRARIFEPYSR